MNHLLPLFISTMFYAYVNTYPAGTTVTTPPTISIVMPFNNIGEITSKKIAAIVNKSKGLTFGPQFPDSGRTHAVLEQETYINKADNAYGNLHELIAKFTHPKPIVDTIQEHEKYGNDGEKFRQVGVAVVNGFEGFSNLLNAVLDIPSEFMRQVGKKVSASLNAVGGKISGL